MEHLALEIFDREGTGSQYANLPEDTSITITDTSEVFDTGDVWSHNFTLNIPANLHIFGTSGELHGSRLHEQVNKRRARLWVMGLPLYYGYLRLADEVDVDENGDIDISFESGQKTFEDLIDGGKANQVPLMGDVKIGMALWRKRMASYPVSMNVFARFKDENGATGTGLVYVNQKSNIRIDVNGEGSSMQQYPQMVFPKGKFAPLVGPDEVVDRLNTDYPYTEDENGTPTHPYCNVAFCYQKHGFPVSENGNVDYSGDENSVLRGYEVMPANRVNSAPNFYVIYWLRCLMKHLGIHIDENQMMDIEDLRRLFFVNTRCAYEVPEKLRLAPYSPRYQQFYFKEDEYYLPELVTNTTKGFIVPNENIFSSKDFIINGKWYYYDDNNDGQSHYVTKEYFEENIGRPEPELDKLIVEIKKVFGWAEDANAYNKDTYKKDNGLLHWAYATSDCFPKEDISTVVEALQNAFGIRLLFDRDYQRVRVVLLRNIFRSNDVQDVACEVLQTTKQENSIRGFRMTFGAGTENTEFYYKGFADKLPHKKVVWPDASDTHDYSQWNLNAEYPDIIQKVSAFDKTCYVTPNTGNAYGIKIDKDAKRYKDLHPSLFEYAGYEDAEDGDCTGEDETIKEIQVGFTPAIVNDLNFEEERSSGSTEQKFAIFVDEEMRSRREDLGNLVPPKSYNDSDAVYDPQKVSPNKVKLGAFSTTSDAYFEIKESKLSAHITWPVQDKFYDRLFHERWGVTFNINGAAIKEGYKLYLQDNYEPNDDGVSPIETHDWGLTLGIMRGSGSDAYVNYSPDPDDNPNGDDGNYTWDIVPGSSATQHPDTCDNYGNLWDYNGSILVNEGGTAIQQMQRFWPNSNINLIYSSGSTQRNRDTYINSATLQTVENADGKSVTLLFATTLGVNGQTALYTGKIKAYARKFSGMTSQQMFAFDAGSSGFGILIEIGSTVERMRTLLELQRRAFCDNDLSEDPMILDDNGVGVEYGRFSLKLRAEKPNPYFDKSQPESDSNRRYLEIENPNLRQRGLMDQFHKEESYWWRNARIAKMKVRMELAQLLAIDKTVRQRVGDITGFIKKMQFTVSNKTGLSPVDLEMFYI